MIEAVTLTVCSAYGVELKFWRGGGVVGLSQLLMVQEMLSKRKGSPLRSSQSSFGPHAQGQTVVAVTSGANMNFNRLRLVVELADVGATQEAMLATTISERPGAFSDFILTALGDSGVSVTELKYR